MLLITLLCLLSYILPPPMEIRPPLGPLPKPKPVRLPSWPYLVYEGPWWPETTTDYDGEPA